MWNQSRSQSHRPDLNKKNSICGFNIVQVKCISLSLCTSTSNMFALWKLEQQYSLYAQIGICTNNLYEKREVPMIVGDHHVS